MKRVSRIGWILLLAFLSGCAVQEEALSSVPELPDGSSAVQVGESLHAPESGEAESPKAETPVQSEPVPENPVFATTLEKEEARIAKEQAELASDFTPEGTMVFEGWQLALSRYGSLRVRKDEQSYIEDYTGDTVYEEDGLTIRIFATNNNYTPKEITGWVLVQRNGVYTDAFSYDSTYLLGGSWDEKYEEKPSGIKDSYKEWDPTAQTWTEFYNKTDLRMVIDLAAREVRASYEIQPGNFKDVLTSSRDGAWDICRFGGTGGGDYWADNVVLRENATGRLQWIGVDYDYSSAYGFFRNGDLYVCEPEKLLILTVESGYTEAAPFATQFGAQADGTKLILHALHRDPGGSGYVVLYSRCTKAQASAEWESPQEPIIFYNMALCDTQGNITGDWPSKYKRAQAVYDYGRVDMTRDGDAMIVRTYGAKGTPMDSFTFSLSDHTFTTIDNLER